MDDEKVEAAKEDTVETSTADPPSEIPAAGNPSKVDEWRVAVTKYLSDSHKRMTALESKLDQVLDLVSAKPTAEVTEEKTEIEPAEDVKTEEAAKPSKRMAGILW